MTIVRRPLFVGAVLLTAAWAFFVFLPPLQVWLYGDLRVYITWGQWIAGHRVPYRDFRLEYPPGSLPAFALPAYARKIAGEHGTYYFWFRVEVLAIALLTLAATAAALQRLGASHRRMLAALSFSAIAPALLGPISFSRYDYWPAFFVAAGVAALAADRHVLACMAFAAGAATKVFPLILLPLALFELWRRGRLRDVARGLAAAGAVLAAAIVPFLVLAPHGLWWAVHRQLVRPLQVESLAAAVFVAAHQIVGLHVHLRHGAGSDNVVGAGPNTAGTVTTIATVLALLLVYAVYLRGSRSKEQLMTACAAAIVAYIAFSKVFSPQYLIWLFPLVPLVNGRRGLRASLLFAVVLGLTQIWSPYRYYDYWHGFPAWLSWLVIVRDLLVVALLAVLLWPERGRHGPAGYETVSA